MGWLLLVLALLFHRNNQPKGTESAKGKTEKGIQGAAQAH